MTETFHTVLAQLQAADAAQRSEAVLWLGKQRETRAVDALVNMLRTETDRNVQEDTTWALVRLGMAALDPLLQVLQAGDHADATVRHNVVHTLGKIGHVRAVDALIMAADDDDQTVRYKAVYALGQIGDTRAIPALIKRLDDPAQAVRWLARDVLADFGAAALNSLITALKTPHTMQQDEAYELIISLLGDIGDPQAVQPLADLLHRPDAAFDIRAAAVQALGQIATPAALTLLEQAALDDDPRIRALAWHFRGQ